MKHGDTNSELNFIEEAARRLAGYDDASLLKEMEWAEQQWELEKQDFPEQAEQVKQGAEKGFCLLMSRIQAESEGVSYHTHKEEGCLDEMNVIPKSPENVCTATHRSIEVTNDEGGPRNLTDREGYPESESRAAILENGDAKKGAVEKTSTGSGKVDEENPEHPADDEGYIKMITAGGKSSEKDTADNPHPELHRSIGKAQIGLKGPIAMRQKAFRRLVVMTAVAMMFGVGGMASVARQGYRTSVYLGDVVQNKTVVMRSNTNVTLYENSIERAYKEIGEKLGIKVLALEYIPSKMKFDGVVLGNDRGVIKLSHKDNKIYLEQKKLSEQDTISALCMDRKAENMIQNDWIDETLFLEENTLDNGKIEYSIQFERDSTVYYLSGRMSRKEFVKVVEELYFWN